MWVIKPATRPGSGGRHQRGSTAVEFALIVIIFLTFIFGVLEFARLMFLYNTLYDATRRGATVAASSDFSNAASMDKVRQQAIFRTSPGGLLLMPELTDKAIRIDYMSLSNTAGTLALTPISSGNLPANPAENRRNCLLDPNAGNCVRLVRVRVCDPNMTDDCKPMHFKTLTSLVRLDLPLPMATTIAQAQTLGIN